MLYFQTANDYLQHKRTINCNGTIVSLDMPIVMGILNITPDSFYDGGRYSNEQQIIERVGKMLTEGATMIDVGAWSSRPGAAPITVDEELQRLTPALNVIKKHFPQAVISVDTYRSEVARVVVQDYNVGLINDISGGTMDDKMFETVALLGVPYIMMHIKGTPADMVQHAQYSDMISEIIDFFAERVNMLRYMGVKDVILDPGFGFAKNIDQNYKLLKQLDHFKIFELPLLVGLSRKSMIYRYLGITPEQALNGTVALNTIALLNGADILRVHDVQQAVETIKLVSKLHSTTT